MNAPRFFRTATLALLGVALWALPALAVDQPDVTRLTQQLRSRSAAQRFEAIQTLARLGPNAKPAAGELAKLLSDQDLLTRIEAASALARIESENARTVQRAIQVLADALRAGDSRYRPAAETGLAAIGRPAVPALLAALKDSNAEVRRSAASGLARIGPAAEEAVPGLLDALTDSNANVRASAARALGSIQADARNVVPSLVARLKDDEAAVRMAAANALGRFGPAAKEAATALAETLKNQDPRCCTAAAGALEKIGSDAEPATAGLIDAFRQDDPNISAHAACAVAVLADDAFAAQRAVLEELFAKRARQGRLYSIEDRQSVTSATDELLEALRERIDDIRPQEYILAKRFIEALGNEVFLTNS